MSGYGGFSLGGGSAGFTMPGTVTPSGPIVHPSSGWLGHALHDVSVGTGFDLAKHFVTDVGNAAINLPVGLFTIGKTAIEHPNQLPHLADGIVKQYEAYYGHNVLSHLYQHPLQPVLDGLTVISGGLGGAAKLGEIGDIARFADLSKRAELVTRSPKLALSQAGGEDLGPSITRLTSNKPIVKLRQQAIHNVSRALDDWVRTQQGRAGEIGPLEAKRYGRETQKAATQQALRDAAPREAYVKAWKKLNPDEKIALSARSLDIHPVDLKELWGDTKNGQELTDNVSELILNPSERMVTAEAATRDLSGAGAELLKRKDALSLESEQDRPGRFKAQASEILGRPVQDVHGDPFYLPHTTEPTKGTSPFQMVGGGRAEPRALGTTKQNLGSLFAAGKLDLSSDVLGPEFLRRVKWLKFHSIHQALKRSSVRITWDELHRADPSGKPPPGWDFLRTSVPQRESQRLLTKITRLEKAQERNPSATRAAAIQKAYADRAPLILGDKEDAYVGMVKQKIPHSIKGEAPGSKLSALIPNPEDLQASALSEGFTTQHLHEALQDESKNFYLVPKSTSKAATGEFTRMSDFMYRFGRQPVRIWRSLLLGLRPAFLVNNLIGNNLMYAFKVGGQRKAGLDLFRAYYETLGPKAARKLVDDSSTPVELKQDILREFYPEQMSAGTMGHTQLPVDETGPLRGVPTTLSRGFEKTTAALPHFTARVAEEAPRRALLKQFIRNSPEFKQVYSSMPRETRSFETAARQLHEGKGGARYQRLISDQVDRAIGNYTHLTVFERSVLRNILPFYSWYRAIVQTTLHLGLDNPLRANILTRLGAIGAETAAGHVGALALPSYLQGAIPIGSGPNGTQRLISTQSLNPWATLNQLGRGMTTDMTQLGLDPYLTGALQTFAKIANQPGVTKPVSIGALVGEMAKTIGMGLPPLAQLFPPGPSQLYPNRGRGGLLRSRENAWEAWLGLPLKEVDPAVAAQRAAAGQ